MKNADSARWARRTRAAAVAIAAVLSVGAVINASASPVAYTFATRANSFGTPAVAGLFSAADLVSGTFTYDPQGAFAVTTPDGSTIYRGFDSLTGSIAGLTFSDVRGSTLVANDRSFSISGPLDSFQLNAEPPIGSTSPFNLTRFATGGYTLVNVRMFWNEGQLGIPDFLVNQNLPAAPPAFEGRLALDFYPSGNISGPAANFVFLDGLRVQPAAAVPEPDTFMMMLAGLGLFGWIGCRRKRLPA